MTNSQQSQGGADAMDESGTGSGAGAADAQDNNAGLPEDVLDAATGAAGMTGSGGPTDDTDLGRPQTGGGDLSGRDLAREPMQTGGGAATSGTDIGSNSA